MSGEEVRRDFWEDGQEKTFSFWFGRYRARDIFIIGGFSVWKGNDWKENGK